jgi:hypothetical protein
MEQGDRFYQAKEINMAYLAYTEAIECEKKNQNKVMRNLRLKILYAKRSLVCFKLAQYKKSLEDTNCALKYQIRGHEEIFEAVKVLRSMIIEQMKTDPIVSNFKALKAHPTLYFNIKIVTECFCKDTETLIRSRK